MITRIIIRKRRIRDAEEIKAPPGKGPFHGPDAGNAGVGYSVLFDTFKHSGRGSISGVWLFSYLRRRNGGALYRL